MQASERTYYRIGRLHALFAAAALALLALTIVMLAADQRRAWRDYQRRYVQMTGERAAGELGLREVSLPELPLDRPFAAAPRVDRCTTCHLGIDGSVSSATGAASGGVTPWPQPFRAHPRLDLFVAEDSPHPLSRYGCTVCHEGQGSATDFRWAGHRPSTLAQADGWHSSLNWSSGNEDDRPMLPVRFAESRCIRCHFEIDDLAGSNAARPAAEKLLAGYDLVRRAGCYGCHEINGFDATGQRVGVDLRLENSGAERAAGPGAAHDSPTIAGIAAPLQGTMRKLGPDLRAVGQRLDAAVLADRIADPKHLLPNGRMPVVYGIRRPLAGQAIEGAASLQAAEVRAVVAYLLAADAAASRQRSSAPATSAPNAWNARAIAPGDVARGRSFFARQGCLACHRHADFPAGVATQGPDLTSVGAKYTAPDARAWLVAWLRDPEALAPRTLMPQPIYDTELASAGSERTLGVSSGEQDRGAAEVERAIADLAAFLMDSKQAIGEREAWRPLSLPPLDEAAVAALELQDPPTDPSQAAQGSAAAQPVRLPHAIGEGENRADSAASERSSDDRLVAIGRRAILRRGCTACHEIPGISDAPKIGPSLTDWGRKPVALLAFEQINGWLNEESHAGAAAGNNADVRPTLPGDAHATERSDSQSAPSRASNVADDADYFRNAIRDRWREGFLWQKLRAPRSFDYALAAKKPYRQWLTMPQFNFTPAEREAVMTLVLGFSTAQRTESYVPRHPSMTSETLRGRELAEQFACAECHVISPERWTIRYRPGTMTAPPPAADYAFLEPAIAPAALAASAMAGKDGFARATIVGRPRTDAAGSVVEEEDDEGNAINYFSLWEPAAIDGQVRRAGSADVAVRKADVIENEPAEGGAYARLVYPLLVEDARRAGATAGDEAWGWTPPPLTLNAQRIRPEWTRQYLLDPITIRPASVVHMPRYGITADEASAMAAYVASLAARRYAAPLPPLAQPEDPAALLEQRNDAMRLLTDRTHFCARCHVIGDYRGEGHARTVLAPDLEQVERRFTADGLRRWIAHPQAMLPYTAMPVNFPPNGEPLSRAAIDASSGKQLDAACDLLLNYTEYLKRGRSVQRMIERSAAEPPR